MTDLYISPVPVTTIRRYSYQIGDYVDIRVHQYPHGDGVQHCDPKSCRECYRERHWKAGQTHG